MMSTTNVRDDQLPRGAGSGGADVKPVLAASIIALRGEPFEILLMRRNEASSFVPGVWVFPGGAVEESDRRIGEKLTGDRELNVMRLAGTRELFEETGIWIGKPLDASGQCRQGLLTGTIDFASISSSCVADLERLVLTSHWITPVGVPKRFDTWFFLVEVPERIEATPDFTEGVEMLWIEPADALKRHREGTLSLVFPTIKNLEAIVEFQSPGELLASREGKIIPITRPILVIEGDRKRIILPDEAS